MGMFDDDFGINIKIDSLIKRIVYWKYVNETDPWSLFDEIEYVISKEPGTTQIDSRDGKWENGCFLIIVKENNMPPQILFFNTSRVKIITISLTTPNHKESNNPKNFTILEMRQSLCSKPFVKEHLHYNSNPSRCKAFYRISKNTFDFIDDLQSVFWSVRQAIKLNQYGNIR